MKSHQPIKLGGNARTLRWLLYPRVILGIFLLEGV